MCGRCENGTAPCDRSPTEHSFGAQSECLPCLDGWVGIDIYMERSRCGLYVREKEEWVECK